MNNLLSKTFSFMAGPSENPNAGPYADLKRKNLPDVEMGSVDESGAGAEHLAEFFREVNVLKAEMDRARQLLGSLRSTNEEARVATKASVVKALRARMDGDVSLVLKSAKGIKARLDALDEGNMRSRREPGCAAGSSTDRTRSSVTAGLRRSLRDLMSEFNTLRQGMSEEYRETIARRYYTVTGNQADEDTLEKMIETGESETFLQEAVREQGRGRILDTIHEIQERHDAVKEIERNLLELHQVFLDMAVLVEAQGENLNSIEASVQGAHSFVKKGTTQLQEAKVLQRSSRKWTCIAIIILLIVILVVIVPILVKFIPNSSNNSTPTPVATPPPPPPATR